MFKALFVGGAADGQVRYVALGQYGKCMPQSHVSWVEETVAARSLRPGPYAPLPIAATTKIHDYVYHSKIEPAHPGRETIHLYVPGGSDSSVDPVGAVVDNYINSKRKV